MAETLISPGVLARENDQSFITQQPVTVGAAIIGPTVKGPVEVPTIVTSYSEYENKFGTGFLSGSQVYTYFTSIAAYNYFVNGGETLLVARVVTGSFSEATTVTGLTGSNGIVNSTPLTTASVAITSASLATVLNATTFNGTFILNGVTINVTSSATYANTTSSVLYIPSGSTFGNTLTAIVDTVNFSSSVATYTSSLQYITGSVSGSTKGLEFFSKNNVSGNIGNTYYVTVNATTTYFSGGKDTAALVLASLSEGSLMNSTGSEDISGSLESGSSDNIRWQIANSDTSQGTFSLIIRQGDDNVDNPIVLETWTNLSMDPTAPNFITKTLGDQKQNYNSVTNQIEVSGSVPNFSKYVRVKSVATPTPLYFDNTGNAKTQFTASIPVNGSGSFANANGELYIGAGADYYETINSVSNIQGLNTGSYDNMIALLSNQDDYRFNVLITPGLFNSLHSTQTTNIINNTQNRGDNIFVLDLVPYNVSTITSVAAQANARNTSYAASYWPWVQTIDPNTGALVWVPASTMVAGVYAYNDSVSEPWFAPAGINRGGLTSVVRAAQKLSQTQRDSLYVNKINPIATFPGTGVVVYGQKTLQTKASALDRVNVRRLLIAVKSFISQIANNLVFEQNTIATRNAFLSQVNPYLTSVQQRQGLYAFKVIMDDSNNTPDVIDRNQLVGQIYLQPTKTAEFIYLNFNILPTGAIFPA